MMASDTVRPRAAATATVAALILDAVSTYRDELPALSFLPEQRYDRRVFPSIGQYDWLAGQVLYALVRHVRPRTMVEFSTSSGYSTSFSALALKRNGEGQLHSVDIDAGAQRAAGRWLERIGARDVVELHLGDCRDVVPRLLERDVDVLFVDTLHSFDIAEWYLCHVVPRLRPGALVHVHDVMPPEARVRIHGGPPYAPEPPRPRSPVMHLIKRFVWLVLHLQKPNPFPARTPREILPLDRLDVVPPEHTGELATIDGNYFEEAVVIRELLRGADREQVVYLHRLESQLGFLDPQRFAPGDIVGRTDARGTPREWNDALWCRAAAVRQRAPADGVRRLVRTLRRRYYGKRASV